MTSGHAPTGSSSDVPLLAMRGITKVFPGVRALDEVDFTLRTGEIHALLGENGAGKSTLIKVLTGVHARDAGKIYLRCETAPQSDDVTLADPAAYRAIAPRSPLEAQALGISTVYQEINLVPYLSVAENMFLGREPRRWGCIRWREIRRRAAERLRGLGVELEVAQPLNSYSVAIQQMVAIARAVDIDARVLILDEPTSSLDARETAELFGVMRRLRAQGIGIVFITHFLEQVYEISDRITVLRNGRLVGAYPTQALPRLELVARMIGKDVDHVKQMETRERPAVVSETGETPALRARGVGRTGVVEPIDLDLHAGQTVGLAGLLGSGRTETARLLFGIDRADCGTLELAGCPVTLRNPRQASAHRIGFCPEDRKSDGIVPDLSVRENVILALQARRGWLRPLGARRSRQLAEHFIRTLRIATPDADKPVGQLSGGNQQKVILARWLASEPVILIVDEPTRGIDVGAKAEIEKLIQSLCEAGTAVLFISSELEEVVRNCHRVAVLRDRKKVGELVGQQIELHVIMQRIAAEPADD